MATTVPLSNRVEINLKREFDNTAEELGLTPTAALTVFMKRFVADGGFPFAVNKRVPTEYEYSLDMDERYRSMRAGNEAEHDLIEV